MKERYFWMDVLRVFAIAAVVMVHVSADIITEWRSVPQSGWWAANFYDSLARGAVPIFIMISGALLLSQTEGYRDFFRKRLQRILIPFIAWTVFYLLWQKYFYEPHLGLPEALRRVANGKVHFHLWFLYLITGLYLLVPFLRVFTTLARRRDMAYFLGLCFFVASLAPFWEGLDGLFFHTGIRFRIPLEAAQGFIGYFLLGFFLLKRSAPFSLAWSGLVWFAAFLICFIGSGWIVFHSNQFPALFYDNMAPNVVFYAASFFIFVKEAVPRIEKRLPAGAKALLLSLSSASFGIYLIHPVFIDILDHGRWGFVLKPAMGRPAWSIPLIAAFIYLCSYLAVLGMRKIPGLRATV